MIELVQTALKTRFSPAHVGALFWPEFGAALLATFAFATLFRRRSLPLLPVAGLVLIAVAAVLLRDVSSASEAQIASRRPCSASASARPSAPALFVTGFTQENKLLQRVFALVELLRGVAAFLAAPIILHLAKTAGASPAAGVSNGMWVCFGIVCAGTLIAVYLPVLGRFRLQRARSRALARRRGAGARLAAAGRRGARRGCCCRRCTEPGARSAKRGGAGRAASRRATQGAGPRPPAPQGA